MPYWNVCLSSWSVRLWIEENIFSLFFCSKGMFNNGEQCRYDKRMTSFLTWRGDAWRDVVLKRDDAACICHGSANVREGLACIPQPTILHFCLLTPISYPLLSFFCKPQSQWWNRTCCMEKGPGGRGFIISICDLFFKYLSHSTHGMCMHGMLLCLICFICPETLQEFSRSKGHARRRINIPGKM